MIHLLKALSLSVVTVAVTLAPTYAAEQTSPIRAALLANYGGMTRLAAISSISITGQINEIGKGKEGPYRHYLMHGRKLRTEALVTLSSSGDVQILNGKRGWKNRRQEMLEIKGNNLHLLVAQYEALFLPAGLLAAKAELRFNESVQAGGKPYDVYDLQLPDTPLLKLFIDPVSLLVARVEWHTANETHSSLSFGDFRFRGGVLFPFRITQYAGEIKVAEIRVDELLLNDQLPANRFLP